MVRCRHESLAAAYSLPVSHFGYYAVRPDRETPLENDDIGVQLLQVLSRIDYPRQKHTIWVQFRVEIVIIFKVSHTRAAVSELFEKVRRSASLAYIIRISEEENASKAQRDVFAFFSRDAIELTPTREHRVD